MLVKFLSVQKELVKQKRNSDQRRKNQKNTEDKEGNEFFLYICIMAKSKIISVPMFNQQKLVEIGNLIKDKKAKRLYYCLDEFYFELFGDEPQTKRKS